MASAILLSPSTTPPSTEIENLQPTSLSLSQHEITQDRLDYLKEKYNRRSVPITSDEVFIHTVKEVLQSKPKEELETELQHRLDNTNRDLDERYRRSKFRIYTKAISVQSTDEEEFHLTSFLRGNSINASMLFVADVLPQMVEKLWTQQKNPYKDQCTMTNNGGKEPKTKFTIATARRRQPIRKSSKTTRKPPALKAITRQGHAPMAGLRRSPRIQSQRERIQKSRRKKGGRY